MPLETSMMTIRAGVIKDEVHVLVDVPAGDVPIERG
jgi:hypothetical protein